MDAFAYLADFTRRRGLKHREVADILNVKTHTVDKYFSDRELPTFHLETLRAYDASHPPGADHPEPPVNTELRAFRGAPLDHLSMLEIRLYATLPASTWGEIFESVEMVLVPAYMAMGADGAIRVAGSCMEPAILDGEIVIIRLADTADPGEVVIARNGDGEYTIKRCRLVNGKSCLVADAAPEQALEAQKAQIVAVAIGVYTPPRMRKP